MLRIRNRLNPSLAALREIGLIPPWQTIASAALNANGDGYTGYTLRQLINSAQILNTGLVWVRGLFGSSTAQALTCGPIFIGQAADAGDAYDYQYQPVEMKFGGQSGFAIAANSLIYSDKTLFYIPPGKNIVVGMPITGGTSNDAPNTKLTQTGWITYQKAASNDPSTIDATGYSDSGNDAMILTALEAAPVI